MLPIPPIEGTRFHSLHWMNSSHGSHPSWVSRAAGACSPPETRPWEFHLQGISRGLALVGDFPRALAWKSWFLWRILGEVEVIACYIEANCSVSGYETNSDTWAGHMIGGAKNCQLLSPRLFWWTKSTNKNTVPIVYPQKQIWHLISPATSRMCFAQGWFLIGHLPSFSLFFQRYSIIAKLWWTYLVKQITRSACIFQTK